MSFELLTQTSAETWFPNNELFEWGYERVKVKAKLSLCLIKLNSIKTWRMETQLEVLSSLALVGDGGQTHAPAILPSREIWSSRYSTLIINKQVSAYQKI
jgi:hypothetical protein